MSANKKNIIVEKFNEKKTVVFMYEMLMHRTKDKEAVRLKIETVKDQMQMLLTEYPEYFI